MTINFDLIIDRTALPRDVETITIDDEGVPYDGYYRAWRGDYDLGTRIGYGRTVETAIEDLRELEE